MTIKIYIKTIYDILGNETSIARYLAIRKFLYPFSSVLHYFVNIVKAVTKQNAHNTIGCGLPISGHQKRL